MKNIQRLKTNWNDTLFVIFVAITSLFLLWKVPYGYIFNDEPFYISMAHRLTFGDAPLADEWHPGQMIGIILYPLFNLVTNIQGGTEGIILLFRYIYVFAWLFVIILTYLRLKQYGIWITIASIYSFLYAPYELMTLSYNFFSMACMLLAGAMLITISRNKEMVIIGALLAISILASPYVILFYLLYFCFVLIASTLACVRKRLTERMRMIFLWRGFLYLSIGAALIAIPFIVFVFRRASISEIIANLPHIFQNSEHPVRSIKTMIIEYVTCFKVYYRHLSIVVIGIFLICLFAKRIRVVADWLIILFGLTCLVVMYTLIQQVSNSVFINFLTTPIVFLGFAAFLLSRKRNLAMLSYWLWGLMYSACVFVGSNTTVLAVTHGLVISGVASFILIGDFYNELIPIRQRPFCINALKKLCTILIAFTCIFQIGSEFYLRYRRSFFDDDISMLTSTIQEGAAKGIITTSERANFYHDIRSDILAFFNENGEGEGEPILIASLLPWAYLEVCKPYGCYSTWMNESLNTKIAVLVEYCNLHRDKTPQRIYILKSDVGDDYKMLNMLADQYEYIVGETKYAYTFVHNYSGRKMMQ